MKALRFTENGLLMVEMPSPAKAEECLVRVLCSGICNTDLEIVRGYAGFHGTLGHEFVGIVESAPERPDLVGKRVVGEINAGCGKCVLCRGGDPRHCPDRTVLGIHGRDGCHAEYLSLPAENLILVPDNVTDEEAVFAEPLAAAYGISEQVNIAAETSVAVIGDGKLGLLCALALASKSKDLLLIGKHPEKLARAGHVETVLLQNLGNIGKKFDVVVEASGSESGFSSAVELVRPRGTIVLKSTFHGTPTWPASRIVVDEITIVGSRCGRFAPAVSLLANNRLDVNHLISDEFPLHAGVAAMERAAQPGVLKVLLRP